MSDDLRPSRTRSDGSFQQMWNTIRRTEGHVRSTIATERDPMARMTRLAVALICTACGCAALVAAVGAIGATGPAQIRITDVQVADRVVPPQNGGRAGTIETIRQLLYNPSLSHRPIGRSLVICTFSDGRDRLCSGTYILPTGSLVVSGALQSRLLYEIAVIGGTGAYDNARGTLTVTATHIKPRHEVLVFRLVG
jgi:hypothetical protein